MTPLWQIWHGDTRTRLLDIPDGVVHTVITSPPYFGLRDYGTGEWADGDEACDHFMPLPGGTQRSTLGDYGNDLSQDAIEQKVEQRRTKYSRTCRKCGARRVEDPQIGLEETVEEYVETLVQVLRQVRRTLRADGTLWLNLGDSYASHGGQRGDGKGPGLGGTPQHMRGTPLGHRLTPPGYKRKDLLGVPWTVALALRADGWFLRSDNIWNKLNAMPSSVKDRTTMAHEYLFMFSKSRSYYFDRLAIREADKGLDHRRWKLAQPQPSGGIHPPNKGIRKAEGRAGQGRNKRTIWTVSSVPYKGEHYASFPPKLIEPCVLAGAPKGGIVLDPFAGTGVAVMVAADHGRRGLGIEASAKSVELARKRVNNWLSGDARKVRRVSKTAAPKPYRIEHRFGENHWTLVDEAEDHEEALELADAFVKEHEGEKTRVIVQHVIERFP